LFISNNLSSTVKNAGEADFGGDEIILLLDFIKEKYCRDGHNWMGC
jgi:hypothetical protein